MCLVIWRTYYVHTIHCGKNNGELQYFVKINKILVARQAENFMLIDLLSQNKIFDAVYKNKIDFAN